MMNKQALKRPPRQQRGTVLIIVLIIMLMVLLMGVSSMQAGVFSAKV